MKVNQPSHNKFAKTIETFKKEVRDCDPESVDRFLDHDVFTSPHYKKSEGKVLIFQSF